MKKVLSFILAAFLAWVPFAHAQGISGGGGGSTTLTVGSTPISGGTSGRLEYNNAGTLGELTTIAMGALTDSWTNSGTTYCALCMTVTNTNSASASRYLAVNNNADGNVFSIREDSVGGGNANIYMGNNTNKCGFFYSGTSESGNTVICNSASASYIGNGGNPGSAGVGLGFRVNVTAKTSNFTIAPQTTSNTYWTNTGASGEVDFSLPTTAQLVAGQRQCFIVTAAQTLKVLATASVTIQLAGSASTSGGNISANAVGSAVCLVSVSATLWVAEAGTAGTWTAA